MTAGPTSELGRYVNFAVCCNCPEPLSPGELIQPRLTMLQQSGGAGAELFAHCFLIFFALLLSGATWECQPVPYAQETSCPSISKSRAEAEIGGGREGRKAFPVPCDNGLGADDHQGTAPSGPDSRNPDPKEPIGRPELMAPWRRPTQDCELVTQRKDLGVG